MEKYDRSLQLVILQALYDAAPNPLSPDQSTELQEQFLKRDHFIANVNYLHWHGLITNCVNKMTFLSGLVDHQFIESDCYITAKGIDFLLDDGGLSAILNIQTIKFHNDTITALEDIIKVSNVPEEQRMGLISRLRELPADAIKHLTNELLTKAVVAAPAALPIIQKFLHGG